MIIGRPHRTDVIGHAIAIAVNVHAVPVSHRSPVAVGDRRRNGCRFAAWIQEKVTTGDGIFSIPKITPDEGLKASRSARIDLISLQVRVGRHRIGEYQSAIVVLLKIEEQYAGPGKPVADGSHGGEDRGWATRFQRSRTHPGSAGGLLIDVASIA